MINNTCRYLLNILVTICQKAIIYGKVFKEVFSYKKITTKIYTLSQQSKINKY